MSIHNTVDASQPEPKDKNHTKDRFGKRHALPDREALIKVALLVLFVVCSFSGVLVTPQTALADVPPQSNQNVGKGARTNTSIDSADLGPLSLNQKSSQKEERPTLYSDGDVAIGFNEDGDPNLGMKF